MSHINKQINNWLESNNYQPLQSKYHSGLPRFVATLPEYDSEKFHNYLTGLNIGLARQQAQKKKKGLDYIILEKSKGIGVR
ncbi:MAG: hypothetical protein ABIF10_03370 [Candidatus Woesearchaeota archaeon]